MKNGWADTGCGHGWVFPNLNGMKARCGGPLVCSLCAKDAASVGFVPADLALAEKLGVQPNGYHCAFCDKHGARLRIECNPPDRATQIFRYFCDTSCLANHGTNQPRPPAASPKPIPARASSDTPPATSN